MDKVERDKLAAEIARLQDLVAAYDQNEVQVQTERREAKRAEAQRKVSDLLEQADEILNQVLAIASEHDLEVSWNGPTYGAGVWVSSGEWQASSNSC